MPALFADLSLATLVTVVVGLVPRRGVAGEVHTGHVTWYPHGQRAGWGYLSQQARGSDDGSLHVHTARSWGRQKRPLSGGQKCVCLGSRTHAAKQARHAACAAEDRHARAHLLSRRFFPPQTTLCLATPCGVTCCRVLPAPLPPCDHSAEAIEPPAMEMS